MLNISILIPTYNRPSLLREAVECCLAQTYAPAEIIIGDDSSNELTREVVEQLRRTSPIPIRYIHNNPSLRQARNINMLFNKASGDKVMLLHDDDLLMPNSLETLVSVFENDPSVSVAYGKQYIIDEQGTIDYPSSETFNRDFYRVSQYTGFQMTPFEAGISQQIPNNGYLIETYIARQLQYSLTAGDACDFDFGYRLGAAGYRTYFVDQYLGKYRLVSDSISHSRTSDCALQAFIILSSAAPESELGKSIKKIRLGERTPIAITEAVRSGKRQLAFTMLFGPFYRNQILTISGLKRLLHALFYVRLSSLSWRKLLSRSVDQTKTADAAELVSW